MIKINNITEKVINLMKESEDIVKLTKKLISDYEVPGLMIALAQDGKPVYQEGFGFRNIEEKLSITEETVFGLASITKSFTSVAIMHLQDKGEINVNDTVIKYLPEFHIEQKNKIKKIKIRHLMTHSSGLPPMSSLDYAMKIKDESNPTGNSHFGRDREHELIDTYEQLLDYIKAAKINLYADPGEHFSYSNEGYGLLGAIIERVSGKTYKQYVYDYIIKPCGMKKTYFTMDEYDSNDNITTSYLKKNKHGRKTVEEEIYWIDSVPMRATGFLKSTSIDMLKYAEIFRNSGVVHGTRIISDDSVKEILKPQIEIQPGRYYGYGLSIVPDYFGNKLVEHGGSLRSISSHFCIIPEKGVSGIILANLMGVPVANVLHKFLNNYFGRDISASYLEHKKHNVDRDKIQSYLGEYSSDEGVHVALKLESNNLVFVSENENYPTMFIQENVFIVYFKDGDSMVKILLDRNEQPYAMLYNTRVVHKENNENKEIK